MVCADYVNIFGGSVHTIKGNADASVVASTETGLEVNADKTKYMIMLRDQNAGRGHGMKIYNSSFGRVNHSKHLWKTITNKISYRNKLRTGNVCDHSVRIGC